MRKYMIIEYDKEDYEALKESMTLSDIVENLEVVKHGYIGDYNFSGDMDDFEIYRIHIAINKAIDIVKKNMQESETNTDE